MISLCYLTSDTTIIYSQLYFILCTLLYVHTLHAYQIIILKYELKLNNYG